jgi:hypothetical protein
MDDSFAYRPAGLAARDRSHILFAQTMGYVALTAGLFAFGAYLGRDLAGRGAGGDQPGDGRLLRRELVVGALANAAG